MASASTEAPRAAESDTKKELWKRKQVVGRVLSGTSSTAKERKVMGEFKEGKLRMGRSGKKVTNPRQALAIAHSEARKAREEKEGAHTLQKKRKQEGRPGARSTAAKG